MGGRCTALFVLELSAGRWLVINRRSDCFRPGKVTQYPLHRKDVPRSRSGRVGKLRPPPGFEPQTDQLVASRYTDYVHRLIKGIPENYFGQC